MKAFSLLISGALLALASGVGAAAQSGLVVSHHEELRNFQLQGSAFNTQGSAAATAAPTVLQFDAMGRTFEIRLENNSRLLSDAARQQVGDDVQVFRGSLAGASGSWARIVVFDGIPRGIVWDGQEMFAIEAPGDNAVGSAAPIVYRLADTYVLPGTMSCGESGVAMSGAAMYQGLVAELNAARAPGATQQINMAAVGDFEFTSNIGGSADAAIVTRLNNVDGIFSNDVGVQIDVPFVETYGVAADPFTDATDSGDLLTELGVYRQGNANHSSQGLTHLYTGKDLDGTTVGIAYTAALCSSRFGAGLSEGTHGATTDSLIAAHEIGHNFGAPHDGQVGSACESETGSFLMAPAINGSNQFSSCSIAEMQPNIAVASCINPLPGTDISISINGQIPAVLLGNSTTLTFNAVNNGTDDASNVSVDITLPGTVTFVSVGSSTGSCTSGAGTANCQLGTVSGGSTETVTVSSITDAVGVATFNATVTADVDDNGGNNAAVAQVTVDPAIDLVVTPPAAQQVDVGASGSVVVAVANQSSLDATNLALSLSADAGLQIDTASWTAGTCTVTGQQVDCQAAMLASLDTSNLTLGVTGMTQGTQNFSMSVSANETDRDTTNNNASGSVSVGSGGGGSDDVGSGSFGAVFLALLATVVARRRRFPPL